MQQIIFNEPAVTRHPLHALRVTGIALTFASVTSLSAPAGAEQIRSTGPRPPVVVVSSGGITSVARALTIRRQFWTNEPGTVYGYGPGNYIVGPYGILYGPYPLDYFSQR